MNERFYQQIEQAEDQARTPADRTPEHCDMVALLGFGLWRYLSCKTHEKMLWVPYLHRPFPRARTVIGMSMN